MEAQVSKASFSAAVTANEIDAVIASEHGDPIRYHVPIHLRITPDVDVSRLRKALQETVDHHPRLRSAFVRRCGELVRVEYASVPVVVDTDSAELSDASEEQWACEVTGHGFVLESAPLLRAHVRVSDASALVVLVAHHAVCDGWSAHLIADEVVRRYLGETLPSHTDGEAHSSETGERAAALSFWNEQAAREPLRPIPDLVDDGTRLNAASGVAKAVVPAPVLAGLRARATEWRTTTAVLGLACWRLALHAWSGHAEGFSLLVLAGRRDDEHDTVGHFSRALPLASALRLDQTIRELVAETSDQVLDALEHAHADASDIDALAGIRAIDVAAYLHARSSASVWEAGGVKVQTEEPKLSSAKFGFSCAFVESAVDGVLQIDFDTAIYTAATAHQVAVQITRMLGLLAMDSAADILVLDLLNAADEPSIRRGPDVLHESLLDLVRKQVETRPAQIALRHHGDASGVSYQQLWDRAAAIARVIDAYATGSGPVALILDPKPETFIGWLGVLIAGRAYLPLDPGFPDAQLRAIVEQAQPGMIVTDASERSRFTVLAGSHVPIATLEELEQIDKLNPRDNLAEVELPHPASPMCVLFTSGSTGTPKGVVLSHQGLARLMQADFVGIGTEEIFSQLSPLNFDGASYEVWGALAQGATLVVIDKEVILDPAHLRTVVRAEGITTMLVTTPLLNRIIDNAPDLLQTLRRVYFGGELISVPHMRRALAHGGRGRLIHSYGPTENSFTSTRKIITFVPDNARTVPIGMPVPGTVAVVVHEETLVPVPVGMPGELLLGGAGIAEGYLDDPERTAQSFVALDTAHPMMSGRGYRTGDRVRMLPSGDLEFLGRWDNQVKIRSQRVELGEVEHVLRAHPEIGEVVVSTTGLPMELVAHCVRRTARVTERAVRDYALARLPRFAVPRFIELVDSLPLRLNGKIDRSRLPVPTSSTAHSDGPRPPAINTAGSVRAAWADVLGTPNPPTETNFFDAGGNSLMLVMLRDRIFERCGATLSVSELMRFSTIEAQAAAIDADASTAAALTPTPVIAGELRGPDGWRMLRVSAASPEALSDVRRTLADFLATASSHDVLANVAHTLDVGRDRYPFRCAILADTAEGASAALKNGGDLAPEGTTPRQPPLVLLMDESDVARRVEALCPSGVALVRRKDEPLHLPTGGDIVVTSDRIMWETGLSVPPPSVQGEVRDAWLVAQLWCLGIEIPLGSLSAGRRIRLPMTRRRSIAASMVAK